MTKKVSEIKKEQGFSEMPNCCKRCSYFNCDAYMNKGIPVEVNLRCTLGGFAVNKMGCCDYFQKKQTL